jgi:hypothetical protein
MLLETQFEILPQRPDSHGFRAWAESQGTTPRPVWNREVKLRFKAILYEDRGPAPERILCLGLRLLLL